jgi:hypothetical protein
VALQIMGEAGSRKATTHPEAVGVRECEEAAVLSNVVRRAHCDGATSALCSRKVRATKVLF